ncbi:MAG: uroporphyrinogen-III C-methyltransferase [Sedimentisphaerales bacterium]|nr:uroporphyrinogen-III C-methyltransferase [Sedimentisphaerales bacterium]
MTNQNQKANASHPASTPAKVYLVGAGPGDPDLITLRARDLIAQADVIIYDHLIAPSLLQYAQPDAELIYVGKQAAHHSLPQDQINQLLIDKAQQFPIVVRLKGGDPFVFGRGGEEALALAAANIPFEIVPGITAAIAAAAYAGIPVTHRDFASQFTLITGHQKKGSDPFSADWATLARTPGTLAFYMAVKNLPNICAQLRTHGMAPDTPAAIIQSGTTPDQRTIVANITDLPDLAAQQNIQPPAMLIIGPVVQLHSQLAWFQKLPLFGQHIVVTRARHQISSMAHQLRRLGVAVIEFPTIKITPPADPIPLTAAINHLHQYDWLIFTSVNGVDAFFNQLRATNLDARHLAPVKICVIGPATAQRLQDFHITPDLIPQHFIAESIVEALEQTISIPNTRILLVRADIARPDLSQMLQARQALVTDVPAYSTVIDSSSSIDQLISALQQDQIDWITFTSSSTVRNFFQQIDPQLLAGKKLRLAAIGPQTAAALQQFNLTPHVQAQTYTIEALIDAICTYQPNSL